MCITNSLRRVVCFSTYFWSGEISVQAVNDVSNVLIMIWEVLCVFQQELWSGWRFLYQLKMYLRWATWPHPSYAHKCWVLCVFLTRTFFDHVKFLYRLLTTIPNVLVMVWELLCVSVSRRILVQWNVCTDYQRMHSAGNGIGNSVLVGITAHGISVVCFTKYYCQRKFSMPRFNPQI